MGLWKGANVHRTTECYSLQMTLQSIPSMFPFLLLQCTALPSLDIQYWSRNEQGKKLKFAHFVQCNFSPACEDFFNYNNGINFFMHRNAILQKNWTACACVQVDRTIKRRMCQVVTIIPSNYKSTSYSESQIIFTCTR
jgi:hypothetical protein